MRHRFKSDLTGRRIVKIEEERVSDFAEVFNHLRKIYSGDKYDLSLINVEDNDE